MAKLTEDQVAAIKRMRSRAAEAGPGDPSPLLRLGFKKKVAAGGTVIYNKERPNFHHITVAVAPNNTLRVIFRSGGGLGGKTDRKSFSNFGQAAAWLRKRIAQNARVGGESRSSELKFQRGYSDDTWSRAHRQIMGVLQDVDNAVNGLGQSTRKLASADKVMNAILDPGSPEANKFMQLEGDLAKAVGSVMTASDKLIAHARRMK